MKDAQTVEPQEATPELAAAVIAAYGKAVAMTSTHLAKALDEMKIRHADAKDKAEKAEAAHDAAARAVDNGDPSAANFSSLAFAATTAKEAYRVLEARQEDAARAERAADYRHREALEAEALEDARLAVDTLIDAREKIRLDMQRAFGRAMRQLEELRPLVDAANATLRAPLSEEPLQRLGSEIRSLSLVQDVARMDLRGRRDHVGQACRLLWLEVNEAGVIRDEVPQK